AASFVSDNADSAMQIGQMGVNADKDRLAPAANFVADKADSAVQIGQMGVNAVKDRLAPAANYVADKADSAKQIGQMGVEAAKDKAQKVGTSVRDMLRGPASAVSRQINEVKQQVKDSSLGQKAGEIKESADKATKWTKNKAVSLYENLGIAQGKLAIPHQYGSCVTMENNGQDLAKNNPLKNHSSKAIDKAYAQNAERLAQAAPAQNVRQNVKIGQRGGGGGGGISM
ncbi:MAG: hypothetical protein NTY98_04505, partial [Verrucomicrobia bacterium]|nr:hypothetical protein [Verrucomicrobiota bacterium]